MRTAMCLANGLLVGTSYLMLEASIPPVAVVLFLGVTSFTLGLLTEKLK